MGSRRKTEWLSIGLIYLFFTCVGKEEYYYIYTLFLFIEKKGILSIGLTMVTRGRCLAAFSEEITRHRQHAATLAARIKPQAADSIT
jgi:hypothetical protein